MADETVDPLAEINAGDPRYGIDARATRPCPACKVPAEPFIDDRNQVRIGYRHRSMCWLHGALSASRRRHSPRDETDYLDGAGPHPFEPADYTEDTR
jgi:hypothetical protein